MSIARLQAALASATNEVTVAAANINFDFALVKVEAPKEYQPLAGILSRKRKHDAESGTSHVTARRLGALFEGICPPTPNLVQAYGKRVSEIAEHASDASKEYPDSVFAAFSGVDATSIWAAATSSKTSLHVHLLACLLARVFEAPEAISIWVELVQEQRLNIAAKLESGESLPFSAAAAAGQQDISRSQLAEWDSSARAWLRTADRVKHRQQTQLRLVLENIDVSVNEETVVFSSVIDAWKSALVTMENLASGMPQAVSRGASILGLSAWHLYPDMNVFCKKAVEVSMKDSLIPVGGVLSLGLTFSERHSHRGVCWSLSLAHMRYYGPPIHAQRQLSADAKRLTFGQLQQAALGTLLGIWRTPAQDVPLYIRFIHTLGTKIEHCGPSSQSAWAQFLTKAASTYLRAKGEDAEMAEKLVQLGQRRSRDFIAPNAKYNDVALFNLTNPNVLFGLLKGHEERIHLLRRLASRICLLSEENTIIRYLVQTAHDDVSRDQQMEADHPQVNERRSPKSENEDMELDDRIADDIGFGPMHVDDTDFRNTEIKDDSGEADFIYAGIDDGNSHSESTSRKNGLKTRYKVSCYATVFPQFPAMLQDSDSPDDVSQQPAHHRWIPKAQFQLRTCELGRVPESYHHNGGSFRSEGTNVLATNLATNTGTNLAFLFGDSDTAAIYIRTSGTSFVTEELLPKVECEDLLWCLNSGYIVEGKLASLLANVQSPVFLTFYALSIAAMVYEHLSDATIDVRILQLPFLQTPFAEAGSPSNSFGVTFLYLQRAISLKVALSLVAYFEGGISVPLDAFDHSIALSAGDSIYVSKRLLCDPWETPKDHELRRILGNVGKPGIVILFTPSKDLMIRDLDPSSWRISTRVEFNGKAVDCFDRTSLHLSFTDYHVPVIGVGSRGQKDSQISLLESIISVRDSGEWVADIDVVHVLQSGCVFRLLQQPPCNHPKGALPENPILSVECWEDVLDCPEDIAVVRSHGNWTARLAVCTVLAQNSRTKFARTTICPYQMCWKCLKQEHKSNVYIY